MTLEVYKEKGVIFFYFVYIVLVSLVLMSLKIFSFTFSMVSGSIILLLLVALYSLRWQFVSPIWYCGSLCLFFKLS